MTQVLAAMLFCCIFSPTTTAGTCSAYDFDDVETCLAHSDANNVSVAHIVQIQNNITLQVGETIFLDDLQNVTLQGNVTISESVARQNSTDIDDLFYIWVVDGSTIKIKDLAFRDASGQDLSSACRYPSEAGKCHAPIIFELGTIDIEVDNVDMDSNKRFLIQLYEVEQVLIKNSEFKEASQFGIWFSGSDYKEDVTIRDSEFTDIGANAIFADSVTDLWIGNNDFYDNHNDRQFPGCGHPDGCSGGQIAIADNGPVSDVLLSGNFIQQTYSNYTLGSCTGIEVYAGTNSGIEDLDIKFNRIEDVERQAIQVHGSTGSQDLVNINVSDNVALNSGGAWGWDPKDVRAVFLNENDFVDADSNRIGSTTGGTNYVKGTFDGTPKTCTIIPPATHCSVNIQWAITNLPAGKIPKVTVNGSGFQGSGGASSGSKVATWINTNNFRFELLLDQGEQPIAVINVTGVPQ